MMMSVTVATRVSSIRCRDPVAVPTRASPTPAHRPTYPHSPRGALESHATRAGSAHHVRRRPTCPSTRNPSTIDPKHLRKRRHYYQRAARLRSSSASLGPLRLRRCTSSGARRGLRRPRRLPERPQRGGSVGSGAGAERLQLGAGSGGDLAARGACARDRRREGRLACFCAIGHVGGLGYRHSLETRTDVRACMWSICMDLLTMCNPPPDAHGLPPF